MKVIAVYKTFDGDEFVEASLRSIYEHVDAIVMVHSSTGWTGCTGNTVRPVAEAWRERNDYADKLYHVDVDVKTQEDQYLAGVDFIQRQGWDYDLLMLVDVDEVWDDEQLQRALSIIEQDAQRHVGYQVQMHIYVKSIFYRIAPMQGTPIAFLRDPAPLFAGARAWNVESKQLLTGVHFHHFTLVRRSAEAIRRKVEQSCAGDDEEQIVDLNWWFAEKWDKLPAAKNLHPFKGRDDFWEGVECVWLDDLPVTVRTDPAVVSRFLPPGELPQGEESILFQLAQGAALCVDLGTLAGRSATIFSLGAEHVVTIDLFEQLLDREPSQEPGALDHARLFSEFNHRYARVARWLAQYSNIEIIQGDTARLAGRFANGSIDRLFVDAGHDYRSVSGDFFLYLPKVARGGIVILHDVNAMHPSVLRLAKRIEGEISHLIPVDLGEDPGSLRAYMRTI